MRIGDEGDGSAAVAGRTHYVVSDAELDAAAHAARAELRELLEERVKAEGIRARARRHDRLAELDEAINEAATRLSYIAAARTAEETDD